MAARKRLWTPDVVRARIQTGVLVQRLRDHALGTLEMTPSQIKAAEILLRKAVPDLKSIDHTGTITRKTVHEYSRDELIAIASRAGIAASDGCGSESAAVHSIQ